MKAGLPRRFLLFVGFSLIAATVDYIICMVLYAVFKVEPIPASTISAHVGIAISFPLNTVLNFKTRDRLFQRFARFYAIAIATMLWGYLLLWIAEFWTEHFFIRKAFSLVVIIVTQFVLNQIFTYQKERKGDAQ